ncbi:hypothetical protein [Varibaculum cambriense]|nr:hypothetical protein [Varibaculum cambriense]MDU2312053.1 hypothetical protein [Varibaculum cambriense]MDU4027113.1 hypothetical protein [Varibaculum cambriense]
MTLSDTKALVSGKNNAFTCAISPAYFTVITEGERPPVLNDDRSQ